MEKAQTLSPDQRGEFFRAKRAIGLPILLTTHLPALHTLCFAVPEHTAYLRYLSYSHKMPFKLLQGPYQSIQLLAHLVLEAPMESEIYEIVKPVGANTADTQHLQGQNVPSLNIPPMSGGGRQPRLRLRTLKWHLADLVQGDLVDIAIRNDETSSSEIQVTVLQDVSSGTKTVQIDVMATDRLLDLFISSPIYSSTCI
ncbi:hypothetical protein K474DRAFT_1368729 [Panus rudis PR-1116 ss-1]|nr:hypothetical protein K474DRAFT_1368729 [Panus rudis PR-1116 ss-1]